MKMLNALTTKSRRQTLDETYGSKNMRQKLTQHESDIVADVIQKTYDKYSSRARNIKLIYSECERLKVKCSRYRIQQIIINNENILIGEQGVGRSTNNVHPRAPYSAEEKKYIRENLDSDFSEFYVDYNLKFRKRGKESLYAIRNRIKRAVQSEVNSGVDLRMRQDEL